MVYSKLSERPGSKRTDSGVMTNLKNEIRFQTIQPQTTSPDAELSCCQRQPGNQHPFIQSHVAEDNPLIALDPSFRIRAPLALISRMHRPAPGADLYTSRPNKASFLGMLWVAKSRNHASNYQFGAGETILISDRINIMELGRKLPLYQN